MYLYIFKNKAGTFCAVQTCTLASFNMTQNYSNGLPLYVRQRTLSASKMTASEMSVPDRQNYLPYVRQRTVSFLPREQSELSTAFPMRYLSLSLMFKDLY